MIIYGINPVSEALHAGLKPTRILADFGKKDNTRLQGLIRAAKAQGIPVENARNLERDTGTRGHQGIAADIPDFEKPLPNPSSLGNRVIMLDGIMDPHNFGAALRVCDVFGFHDVIYFKGNSSGITPAAVKVSSGAAFHLNIFQCNLNTAVRKLKDAGYQILIMDAKAEHNLYEVELPERLCLVMGAEDKGVRHAIKRLADLPVNIPMRGHVDSLNVSCALSAALSEISRRSPWT